MSFIDTMLKELQKLEGPMSDVSQIVSQGVDVVNVDDLQTDGLRSAVRLARAFGVTDARFEEWAERNNANTETYLVRRVLDGKPIPHRISPQVQAALGRTVLRLRQAGYTPQQIAESLRADGFDRLLVSQEG